MSTRKRIDQNLVVQTAIQIADAQGFEAATLKEIAKALDIQIPSLYNHVPSLAGLHSLMSLWAGRTLMDRLRRSAVGKAGADALMSVAVTYRAFAQEHPGVYRLTLRAPTAEETELTAVAQELLDLSAVILQPFGLSEEEMLHTIRGWRSVMHGFIDLEILGGFGLSLDRDESYRRLVMGYIAGIKVTSPAQRSSS